MERTVYLPAIQLIKQYEGLHERIGPDLLKAYFCPAGIWTIGWGSTAMRGMPVMPGTHCTLAEADSQFQLDLKQTAAAVERLVKVSLTDAQFGALVSLVYNIGASAFASSTLLRKLNANDCVNSAMRVEFPRWVKGNDGQPLPGLVKRRQAELALLEGAGGTIPLPESAMIRFSDAAKYDRGLARQADAWRYLFTAAPTDAWDAFQAKLPDPVIEEFARRFRSGVADAQVDAVPVKPTMQQQESRILAVPYYSQRDNYRDRDRTCFSSTNAMALKFLRPKAIDNDDDYIRTVFSIGDTTDAAVQVRALARYGVNAVFRQDANFDLVRAQINKGIPVPFGWVHRGPVSLPRGTGHWALAIGYTSTGLVVHDPWGEPDLVTGETLSPKGKSLQYSYKNLGMRWMVKPAGAGTYRYAPNQGWCLLLA
jgi:GH24 family phage-related lysozyme (muramidase)